MKKQKLAKPIQKKEGMANVTLNAYTREGGVTNWFCYPTADIMCRSGNHGTAI